ncbi:uncharacterized protein LOC135837945 [Planococcus citri]|uniref:uncharacterized protein LOC135837945 n=1 Tax=Planococcus citri TaxID=170843 RepID=UPI0031F9E8C9
MDDDSPTKLQSLAAKSICVRLLHEWAEGEIPVINVWRRAQGYGTNRCNDHDFFLWQLTEMQVPHRFANISSEIQYQIEDNLVPILTDVYWWIIAHHTNFFHDTPSSPLNEYVVKLVWNRHFKIDNLATAKNILTNEKLSLLERFRFASVYCLVDEIEKFRGSIDSIPKFDFKVDPFVAYWSKYLRNMLRTISVPKNSSIEMLLFNTAMEHGLWPTVEYFFDQLDSAKKTSKFESILERFGEAYPNDFSAGLANKKWNPLCCFASSKIIARIARYGTPNQVRIVWKLYKYKMDSKNFCDILETLVPLSMRNAKDFEKWTPLLMEIWTGASNKLKQSAIVDTKLWQSIGDQFIYHVQNQHIVDFRTRRLIKEPMKFIKMVLKSTGTEKRTVFFEKNFFWLVLWAPIAAVDRLMRDFLERYNRDVFELKKVVAKNYDKMKWLLYELLAYGEYDEIDAVVSFYLQAIDGVVNVENTSSEDVMRNNLKCYMFEFLTASFATDRMCSHIYQGDWRELQKYVEENVSWVSADKSKEIMKKVITTKRYWTRKIETGEMNDLKEFASTVYYAANTNSQLKSLKRQFESHLLSVLFKFKYNCRKIITFDRAALRNFLLWIYDGDERLIEENFEHPRLFSEGFLVQLKGCVAKGSFQVTKSMEEFLKWCFENEEETQPFKRSMIFQYRDYRLIEGLLMRRKYRPRMLLWCFDGDTSWIKIFTTDYGRRPLYGYFISDGSSDETSSGDDSD